MAISYGRNYLLLALGCGLSALIAGCNPAGPHRPLSPQGSDSAPGPQKPTVTYEAVKPVIEQRCARCHNSGTLNWMDKALAVASARSGVMRTNLVTRTMPKAQSVEAASITELEREKLLAWVDSEMNNAEPGQSDPSIVRDRNLAVVARCMTCHGPLGVSISDDIPNLAGHGRDYFLNRLTLFLTTPAPNTMLTQLQSLSTDFKMPIDSPDWQATLAYAAQYFSSLVTLPSMTDIIDARMQLDPATMTVYEKGQAVFQDQACTGCHLGVDLRPLMSEAPMIFAQKAAYLTKRLQEFKNGLGGEIMPSIVESISDADIQALVVYLKNTHPGEVRP